MVFPSTKYTYQNQSAKNGVTVNLTAVRSSGGMISHDFGDNNSMAFARQKTCHPTRHPGPSTIHLECLEVVAQVIMKSIS